MTYIITKKLTLIVGDISLKIWANCANSDTSMKISDKHYDSISFTYGLLAIIFIIFSRLPPYFLKWRFFFIRNILSNEIRFQIYCLLVKKNQL